MAVFRLDNQDPGGARQSCEKDTVLGAQVLALIDRTTVTSWFARSRRLLPDVTRRRGDRVKLDCPGFRSEGHRASVRSQAAPVDLLANSTPRPPAREHARALVKDKGRS